MLTHQPLHPGHKHAHSVGREVQQAAHGHTVTKWPSWDLNPNSLAFKAMASSPCDSPSSCRCRPALSLSWKAQ